MSWSNGLPVEILEEIFSYLPFFDRCNVRLVCKGWRKVSWSSKLCNDDWVKISDDNKQLRSSLQTMTDVFNHTDEKPFNFILIRSTLALSNTDKQFWTGFGPSMRKLYFFYCDLNATVLLFILENCSRLEELQFHNCDLSLPKQLSKSAVERVKVNLSGLKSLLIAEHSIFSHWKPLLQCITNVRELDFCVEIDGGSRESNSTATKKKGKERELLKKQWKQDQLVVFNELINSAQIQTVALDLHVGKTYADTATVILTSKSFTLKTLRVHALIMDETTCSVLESLTQHRDSLTSLSFRMEKFGASIKSSSENKAFNKLLRTVSLLHKLNYLQIKFRGGQCSREAHAISKRMADIAWVALGSPSIKLESLQLTSDIFNDDFVAELISSLPFSEGFGQHLKCLGLKAFPLARHLLRPQTRLNLQQLTQLMLQDCEDLTDRVIQQICTQCKALVKFSVCECRYVSDRGLTGEPNLLVGSQLANKPRKAADISNLKCLEELCVWGDFRNPTLNILKLARLRSLDLNVMQLSDASLLSVTRNCRALESFSVDHNNDKPWHCDMTRLTWHGLRQFIDAASPRLTDVSFSFVTFNEKRLQDMKTVRPSLQKINGQYLRSLPNSSATAAAAATGENEGLWPKKKILKFD